MNRIPAAALLLGIAGLVPFIWGAMLSSGYLDSTIADPGRQPALLYFGTDGALLMLRYGGIILPFMSGVLWGFATRADGGRATPAYILSVLPALWWFIMPGTGPTSGLINLMTGFVGVLLLDFAFWKWGLAPRWWMALRVPLSIVVLVCLGVGVLI